MSTTHQKTEGTAPSPTRATSIGPLVVQALRLGVFSFLATRDVVMLLNCCKAFRNDSECAKLALVAGLANKHASHLFRDCGLDWFNFNSTRYPLGFDREEKHWYKCEHEPTKATKMTGHLSDLVDTSGRPRANAQLVSLIAAFRELILTTHPSYHHCVSTYGDRAFAILVAISLWDHHPDKLKLQPDHDWTREDIHRALNVIHEGFGDRFTEQDPAKGAPSNFGAHWEHIQMSAGGEITCTLCDKWRYITKRLDAVVAMTKSGDAHSVVLDALSASDAGRKYGSFWGPPIENVVREDDAYTNCSELQLLP